MRHPLCLRPAGAVFLLAWLFLQLASRAQAVEPADGAPYFEQKILPLLKEHCYSCHSHASGKMRGGLSLDSRSGWEKGGDSGPSIVPGDPRKSLLIQAVQYTHADTKMPPREKLDDAAISMLVEWVKAGASDPRVLAQQDGETWWSLKPIARVAPPAKGHPIDAFIDAALRAKGLTRSPEADRRTLIRRLTLDLHGLPPTVEEVEAFELDRSPDAYEKLVDRLLASPRYGERWARHWLDVNRYGDSDGNEHDKFRDDSWRYRDYVIDALNQDKPYDRFIKEQCAADVFYPQEAGLTAALGYLAAGPVVLSGTDYQNRDEFVTQVMSGITSTTAHCARCHNHKFDPITQDDYYALQAIFAGVQRRTAAVDLDPAIRKSRSAWQALKKAPAQNDRKLLLSDEAKLHAATWGQWSADRAPKWRTLAFAHLAAESKTSITQRQDGSVVVAPSAAASDTYVLEVDGAALDGTTLLRLEILADPSLPGGGPGLGKDGAFALSEFEVVHQSAAGDKKAKFKSVQADAQAKDRPAARIHDLQDATAWDGNDRKAGGECVVVLEMAVPIKAAADTKLALVLKHRQGKQLALGRFRLSAANEPLSPFSLVPVDVAQALKVPVAQRSEEQWLALTSHALPIVADLELAKLPPPTSFSIVAGLLPHEGKAGEPKSVSILKRGDLDKPMRPASPGALSCVSDLAPRVAAPNVKHEPSRRAYLAEWLVDERNPLTWRSIVNRVWHYHFGKGLVDTVNDFGRMGSQPTHPELLDFLADEFRQSKSLKALHKRMVTSAAYRQAVRPNAKAQAVDADNRLLWRMNRERLDAESYRDALLATSGQLDLKMGGPGVLQFEVKPGFNTTKLANYEVFDWNSPGAARRSIYRFIFRTRPDPFLSALDFPDASQFVSVRSESATALQALVLFNNPFVLYSSEKFAERIGTRASDTPAQVREAFRLALLREPSAAEAAQFAEYVQRHGLAAMCRVLFNCNEFVFVE